jgi:hypothetical protein
MGVAVAAEERAEVLARGVAQALLVEDQRGRAELGGKVGEGASANRQTAVRGGLGRAGKDVEETLRDGRRVSLTAPPRDRRARRSAA